MSAIDNMQAGPETDVLVAEYVMGEKCAHPWASAANCSWVEYLDEYEWTCSRCGKGLLTKFGESGTKKYSTDAAAAMDMEANFDEDIESRETYVYHLCCIVTGKELEKTTAPPIYHGNRIGSRWDSGDLFALAHATPLQRCRAALKAVRYVAKESVSA